jgi:hypothetical protein
MSFRDIGYILKDADKNKEVEQQRTQQERQSSEAYKLFSQGKSSLEVAVLLNIKASEAIGFQGEYWELEGLHDLNLIYEEIKGNTWHFVSLYNSVKAWGMNASCIEKLLRIANNYLPSVEY